MTVGFATTIKRIANDSTCTQRNAAPATTLRKLL